MLSIECRRKKCPAAKKLIPDAKNRSVGHCEFFFNLVNGIGKFTTPDGKIHQSSFFEIQADSEVERAQKLKCLRKLYGEVSTRVFENLPGTNPLVEWGLTPGILMQLSACVEKLHNYNELVRDILDPDRTRISIDRETSTDVIEVWSRFIYYRFSLTDDKSMSSEDRNNDAVEWTFEDIEEMASEESMAVFKHIAEQLREKDEGVE